MICTRAPAVWMTGLLLATATPHGARGASAFQNLPARGAPASQAVDHLPAQSSPPASEVPLAPPGEDGPKTGSSPSTDAWKVINWAIATRDNNDLPFMVIDKLAAEVFVFDGGGQKIGSAPALVGMAEGDEDTPGTGDRELSNIPPKDRKTPAGRFVAKFGYAAGRRQVLWIDYSTAISLHAVITVRKQNRFARLKSPTPDDNRITYGCINVPAAFYAGVVKPLFKGTSGIVYILPDTKSLNDVFPAMPPQSQTPMASTAQ